VIEAGVRMPVTPNISTMVGTHPNQPINNQMKKQVATVAPNRPSEVRTQPISARQSIIPDTVAIFRQGNCFYAATSASEQRGNTNAREAERV